jgi:SAM-dependent methyltransferase
MPARKSTNKPTRLSHVTSFKKYDFIDLGCGDGASLVNFEKKIGGRGLGIELNRRKVKKAQELGRNVVHGNALSLSKIPGKVDFVTCDNFLEHLLSHDEVEKMLEQAVKVARKFVYIRHPSFEDIDYLATLKLKTYWSDWRGHTAMLRVSDLVDMLFRQGIHALKVVPVGRIHDSGDGRVIPLDAPADQHDYVPGHGPKPDPAVAFDRQVYFAFDIVGVIPGAEDHAPELIYPDRLADSRRPRFEFKSEEIRKLQLELDAVRNRRSVRLADWPAKQASRARRFIDRARSKKSS